MGKKYKILWKQDCKKSNTKDNGYYDYDAKGGMNSISVNILSFSI